jgi:hypothetical protein
MWRAVSAAAARQARRGGAPCRNAAPAARRAATMEGFNLPSPKTLSEIVKVEARQRYHRAAIVHVR